MVAVKIQRKAATPKGILRRRKDADFEAVSDPRQQNRITHPLSGVLQLGVVGLATDARSQRSIETRSTQLAEEVDEACGLDGRISDNAFGLILRRIEPYQLRCALHRSVRAEWIGRENLRPTRLDKSTVAIDGKNMTTLRERELRRLISAHTKLDGAGLTVEQLRHVYATRFPEIQLRDDSEAGLIGVAMVHRATLVSSDAALVIDQRSIPGTTSEHGEITHTLEALCQTYGRTKMLERVTVDAGNMYRKTAQKACAKNIDYFGDRSVDEADQAHIETRNGETLVYRIWTMKIAEGTLGWDGARQLIRIQRVAVDIATEEVSVGERYFVSSEAPSELDPLEAYRVARAHWRCENEGHWTADAIWREDARRTPWTKHPTGIINVGILRAIAINILILLRPMSRLRKGDQLLTPGWKQVIEHAVQALLTPVLETGDFDAFDN